MRTYITAICLGWSVAVSSAHGGDNADAEQVRLEEELTSLASRSAWVGVERVYQDLVSKKKGLLDYRTHLLGAYAANDRGDLKSVFDRLKLAKALNAEDQEVNRWFSQIGEVYTLVNIEVSHTYRRPITLQAEGLGFQPDAVRSVEAAQKWLERERAYYGPLPRATYQLNHVRFEVAGKQLMRVELTPGKKRKASDL